MRKIMGWRFVVAIALPILLASLGVLSLTTDLLDRVSQSADAAENNRNREVAQRALNSIAADLLQLARDNASWDVAYEKTYPSVDQSWLQDTWGSINSIGTSYERVYVVEANSAVPIAAAGLNAETAIDLKKYLGPAYVALAAELQRKGFASTYLKTAEGPALVAAAKIVPRDQWRIPVGYTPRSLIFVKAISHGAAAQLQSRYLLRDVSILPAAKTPGRGLIAHDLSGATAFGVTWDDRALGAAATAPARQKATMVLGFLILVMGGIAVVCWRLIMNIAESEERAVHQALHDPLTELPNRAAMTAVLRELHKAQAGSFAVAYADLDGFKEVNDNFGHQVGDRLLRAVGAGITRLANGARLAARMGGDEFVVIFAGPDAAQEAATFANHLLRFLSKPFDLDGRIAFVGASIGIAAADAADKDELEILRRADIAMYKAKAEGKNRHCLYQPAFDVERSESQSIAAELTDIVARRTLDIVFQPVVSARNLRMSGVEALARWPSSSSRHFPPDKFIAVAETCGLIDDLGELILDKACAAARNWPGLRLAVNISAVQLNNPNFVERAMVILERHGIQANTVEFEITETSLIRDADRAKQVFKELQRFGIKIALDDFGTGFSSIGYLRRFAFDRIKIDRSITSKVLSNPAELAIVQGTLLVARGLSAEVTAEGVEREEEVAVLKLAGCTELQGYFFNRPLPAESITEIMRKSSVRPHALLAG